MRERDDHDVHAFVVASWASLFRTAVLLVGNRADAEDLVQSTLVRVVDAWPRIRRRDAPEVYARRVLINLATNRWRRLLRHADVMRRHGRVDDAPDLAGDVAVRDAVWKAVMSLPVGMRAVLVLRYFEDYPEADTARVLKCSPGTVKSQTSKALARPRERLDRYDLDLRSWRPSPHRPARRPQGPGTRPLPMTTDTTRGTS
ncbi:MAG: SigE family RNA polymerase sigma factor [Jiangellaceae bacterium]